VAQGNILHRIESSYRKHEFFPRRSSTTNPLVVTTYLLSPEEEFIVGRQIRKVLKK
jgi:hypothetical protein